MPNFIKSVGYIQQHIGAEFFSSIVLSITVVILRAWSIVECLFLKPNRCVGVVCCSSSSICFNLVRISLSNSFDSSGNNDIGL